MSYPVGWGLSVVLAIAAVGAAKPATALDQSQRSYRISQSAPEFTPASDFRKGQLFMTSGLVCDRASEVDAVITLVRKGEELDAALKQVNAGAKMPRCIVGRALVAKYVNKERSFTIADQLFQVHQVQIIGVAVETPSGVVPVRLEKPMKQYVVSTDDTVSA